MAGKHQAAGGGSARGGRRAVIYCRRAPDDRDAKGARASIATQREECLALSAREGYRVVDEFVDDGISGRTWPAGAEYDARAADDAATARYVANFAKQRRPGFARALDALARGRADVVVVQDMKRFSRPIFLSGFTYFLHDFVKAHKGAVHSCHEGLLDFKDDLRLMSYLIQDATEDKGIRVRAAYARAAVNRERERGRYIAPCVPWGYKRTPEGYRPDGAASKLIKNIYQALAKGKTLASLVVQLQDRKIPTPRGAQYWSRNTVAAMLKKPVYMGKVEVNGKFIPCIDVAEPIVDEKLFAEVQGQFKARKRVSKRSKAGGGLATGIVRCGKCKSAMVLFRDGFGRASYRCIRRVEIKCTTAIKSDNLDDFLAHFLELQPILARAGNQEARRRRQELASLYAKESELQRRIRALNEQMVNPRAKFDVRIFANTMAGANERLLKLQQRIDELDRPAATTLSESDWQALTPEERQHLERREVARQLFDKVLVFDNRVDIFLRGGEKFSVKRTARSKNGLGKWLPEPVSTLKGQKRLKVTLPDEALKEDADFLAGALELRRA